ncbi:MAG: putative tellurite resistance protein B-like protein [Polyangiales bacterium]
MVSGTRSSSLCKATVSHRNYRCVCASYRPCGYGKGTDSLSMGHAHQLTLQDRWAIYETTVVLAWADGRLSADEIQAARVVAEELSLSGPFSLAGVKLRLAQTPIPEVSADIALLAYACAVWMAHADGQLHRRESILLGRLQRRLGIENEAATQTARFVCQLGSGLSQRASFQQLLKRSPELLTNPSPRRSE